MRLPGPAAASPIRSLASALAQLQQQLRVEVEVLWKQVGVLQVSFSGTMRYFFSDLSWLVAALLGLSGASLCAWHFQAVASTDVLARVCSGCGAVLLS